MTSAMTTSSSLLLAAKKIDFGAWSCEQAMRRESNENNDDAPPEHQNELLAFAFCADASLTLGLSLSLVLGVILENEARSCQGRLPHHCTTGTYSAYYR